MDRDVAQDRGYLVVRLPEQTAVRAKRLGDTSADPGAYFSYLKQLHDRIPEVLSMSYAGVDRFPVECGTGDMAYLDHAARVAALAVMRSIGLDATAASGAAEERASLLLAHRLRRSRETYLVDADFDPDLIPDLVLAREVHAATQIPRAWDIINVMRGDLLGAAGRATRFDVATWSAQHVSAIRDVFLAPEYSPAVPRRLSQLAQFVRRLGRDMLFSERAVAHEFLQWYQSNESDEGSCGRLPMCVVGVVPCGVL